MPIKSGYMVATHAANKLRSHNMHSVIATIFLVISCLVLEFSFAYIATS